MITEANDEVVIGGFIISHRTVSVPPVRQLGMDNFMLDFTERLMMAWQWQGRSLHYNSIFTIYLQPFLEDVCYKTVMEKESWA